MKTGPEDFTTTLLTAPLGVATLAALELEAIRRTRDPNCGVPGTTTHVKSMSFGEFLQVLVQTSVMRVGPWIPLAPQFLEAAYARADERRPIAEAISSRFGTQLHEPLALTQEIWLNQPAAPPSPPKPRFVNFDDVYDAGEYTEAGLWTCNPAPREVHAELVGAWELYSGPITRWQLPLCSDTRVFEIHRAEDWHRLVLDHPRRGRRLSRRWELPGLEFGAASPGHASIGGGAGVNPNVSHVYVPNWTSVAGEYDAVHLSWAGLISAEGHIRPLEAASGAVMLRYWFTERTLWLSDCFGKEKQTHAPYLPIETLPDGSQPVLRARDRERRDIDRTRIRTLLGRLNPAL